MDRGRLAFINIYKIFAAIIIGCFLHYQVFILSPLNEPFEAADRVTIFLMGGRANYLVELFFMMSGLLFAFVYREKIENGELQFSTFLNKRLYRLMPLLIVTTLVIFPFRVLYEHRYGLSFFGEYANLNSLVSAVFLSNSTLLNCRINPPGWQIGKLIPCYVLAYVLSRYHKKLGWITFLIPIMAGFVVQQRGMDLPLLEFHMSRAYIAFFIGVMMEKVLAQAYSLKMRILCSGGGVILVVIPIIYGNLVADWSSVSTIFTFTGMILIGYNSNALNHIGKTRLFSVLGDISFDLYLWNCPILLTVLFFHNEAGLKVNTYLFLIVLICVHIVVAYASSICRKCLSNLAACKLQLF